MADRVQRGRFLSWLLALTVLLALRKVATSPLVLAHVRLCIGGTVEEK